jgi:hypothetical protein
VTASARELDPSGTTTSGSTDGRGVGADGRPERRLPDLEVRVRHASLEHALYRLYIGHFQGLPLSGGEARLNERSEGRLERLLVMNLYPQRLGDLVMLEPVDEAPPRGIVVVGLGPAGELTGAALRGVFTRALLRVAMEELDRRVASGETDTAVPLGVSTVLIGTSASGSLPVEGSVRALIDATTGANARLSRIRVATRDTHRAVTDLVWFGVLEIIERYEDRVDLIVNVLAHLRKLEEDGLEAHQSRVQSCRYTLKPARAEGASGANSPIDQADEVWRRVDIRAHPRRDDPTLRLEFTSIGRLARAERLIGHVELAIVKPLLENAISNHTDTDVSGTLYELLVPQELKGELGSAEHLHLLVDEKTADLPWELLRPRPDDQEAKAPLALRVGVLRQFRETERIRFEARRASGNNALVIGNPPTPDAPSLAGAENEAVAVSDLLRKSRWTVKSLVWDTEGNLLGEDTNGASPLTALHQLMNGDWRVVHIAAHGEFSSDAASSGVLLGDFRLTANVFSKLSIVPDLVVINACHLGRTSDRPLTGANRMAASVARALMQIGVRAVVVAGWAVDDIAAQRFAESLYADLLRGQHFGGAVVNARQIAWEKAPGSLTWGAYQCYGDPGFYIEPRRSTLEPQDVWTIGELRRRVNRLYSVASDQGRSATVDRDKSNDRDIRKELGDLTTCAEDLEAADVLTDLAEVWAELLDYDRAIDLYRRGVRTGGSGVRLKAVEQLGNLLIREARVRARANSSDPDVNEKADEALTWLERASDIGPTGERFALLGSYYKKRAAMAQGAERQEHLGRAVHNFGKAQQEDPKPYHQYNLVQLAQVARLIQARLDDKDEKAVEAETAKLRATLAGAESVDEDDERPAEAEDFWTRTREGDRLVTALLLGDDDEATTATGMARLVLAYERAFALRSSPRERASVTDHLIDLADLLPSDHRLAAPLRDAHERLRGWGTQDTGGDGLAPGP